eukprot:789974-Amphidinium_carterae.1
MDRDAEGGKEDLPVPVVTVDEQSTVQARDPVAQKSGEGHDLEGNHCIVEERAESQSHVRPRLAVPSRRGIC